MQDITAYFPGCTLSIEQLRNSIKTVLGLQDSDAFCYKCFCYLGEYYASKPHCLVCFRVYCERCAKGMSNAKGVIEPARCTQCMENAIEPQHY